MKNTVEKMDEVEFKVQLDLLHERYEESKNFLYSLKPNEVANKDHTEDLMNNIKDFRDIAAVLLRRLSGRE